MVNHSTAEGNNKYITMVNHSTAGDCRRNRRGRALLLSGSHGPRDRTFNCQSYCHAPVSANSLKCLVVVVYHTNISLVHNLHCLVVWFTALTVHISHYLNNPSLIALPLTSGGVVYRANSPLNHLFRDVYYSIFLFYCSVDLL